MIAEDLRVRSRDLLAKALNEDNAGRMPDRRVINLATELEASIHSLGESQYKESVRSRAYNLRQNADLRYAFLNSQISAARLARMSSVELANKEVKQLYDKIEAEVAKEADISGQGLEGMTADEGELSLGHKPAMLLWSGGDADARIG
ncbi:hypothetical protein SmJEL517_g00577 [Synchytrium microbalum]|uniref:TFIIS central domain-containing protein n=1 Tax=Synchytrium microbalum TaxID=1806994 RepID=A0A507CDG7_9FUNG|nr:uncharacterized protein SmJEL517_g00577 [Synchytrium microbalum]TPX37662.1 hypothetical protein SmJEL517_g00577 [Synchytrium microbalum]